MKDPKIPVVFLSVVGLAAALAGGLWAAAGCGPSGPTVGQVLPIGSPCAAASQCGTVSAFFCDKAHPGGYCKRDCKADKDCPPEAICAFDGATGACHHTCATVNDCRKPEGYICKPASTDPAAIASHAYCDVDDAPGVTDGGTDGATGG